jgi:uncharacterized protein (TIRG00374 family)
VRRLAAIGVLASGVFLWLALRKLDLGGVAQVLVEARPWPWIPLAILSYGVGHLLRGLRCRLLVSREANLPVETATGVVVFGYAVNNVLPARLGELARAALLRDRTGIPFAQTLTVTLLERLLDGWTLLLLFVVASGFLPAVESWMLRISLVATGVLAAFSLAIACFVFFPHFLAHASSRIAAAVRPAWQDGTWRLATYVSNGLAYLRRPADAVRLVALSGLVWIAEGGMFLATLAVFDLPLRPEWALLAMAVTNLGMLVPSAPGFIGPFHYFCMQTLVLLGVAPATAASYALTVHAVFFVPITFWGAGILLWYGVQIGSLFALGRESRRVPVQATRAGVEMLVLGEGRRAPRRAAPGQLIRSITEAVIPDAVEGAGVGGCEGTPPANPRLEAVSLFVQEQIDALPGTLRLLLALGLGAFRVAVRVACLRSFCALPLARRRRIVSAFAYGRYALARQLFRVLRSTALLGYYELAGSPAGGRPLGGAERLR